MILFAALATLLALLLVAWLLWPARSRREVSLRDANISIYRDQLRELDADLTAAKIAPEDHQRARRELERRLLDDVAPGGSAAPARRRSLGWAAGFAIPVAAIGIYFVVGSPRTIDREAEH